MATRYLVLENGDFLELEDGLSVLVLEDSTPEEEESDATGVAEGVVVRCSVQVECRIQTATQVRPLVVTGSQVRGLVVEVNPQVWPEVGVKSGD